MRKNVLLKTRERACFGYFPVLVIEVLLPLVFFMLMCLPKYLVRLLRSGACFSSGVASVTSMLTRRPTGMLRRVLAPPKPYFLIVDHAPPYAAERTAHCLQQHVFSRKSLNNVWY
jgi:hypothetical protein